VKVLRATDKIAVFTNVRLSGRYVPDSERGRILLLQRISPTVQIMQLYSDDDEWNRFRVVADSPLHLEFVIAFLTQESGE